MPTPKELRARADELEDRISPIIAGPRTDDERLFGEKAAALRAEADRLEAETTPGTTGTLAERISDVIANEVPAAYAALASARAQEVVAAWQDDTVQTLHGVRAWAALYRPQLSPSAAQALDGILAEHRDAG
ncbi:hypothetical protein [Streptomyces californicus]|uniref:hypothetical protein n=1 Tax=Streptomyces californicus TaxID=67351 RepID=UPI00296E30C7|nr:hypothetical protein [Streptomyces californicus]MDW4912575.1 hypothetical protein [Streptomyces californicus]